MTGKIHTAVKGKYKFIQLFAQSLAQAGPSVPQVIGALAEGGYLWLCYPKGTSKKYKSDYLDDLMAR